MSKSRELKAEVRKVGMSWVASRKGLPFWREFQMAATQSGVMSLSDEDARRQLHRAVIASTIGTTTGWYAFSSIAR